MNKKSPFAWGLIFLLSAIIAFPPDLAADAQASGQRAGEVARVIPAVSIARGSKTLNASARTVVNWQDLVNTQATARARISLDDGSVVNVGSASSFKVVKHDAGAQQTELELTYGKLRTQAQKIAKPDGKFEVRTPAGVAGVVGTDFYVAYDNSTTTMTVVVFEGFVKVCNLGGVCVIVKAGQMTSIRSGDNSAPQIPTQAALEFLVAATQDTDASGPGAGQAAGTISRAGRGWTTGLLLGIPAVVLSIMLTRKRTPVSAPVTIPKGCVPQATVCG
jgi:hypothetical protein